MKTPISRRRFLTTSALLPFAATAGLSSAHAAYAPYAVNWQIKETMQSNLKSPRVDLMKLVTIIRKSGYRGYVPIETLAMGRKDYDPHAEVTKMLTDLRAALAATEPAPARS